MNTYLKYEKDFSKMTFTFSYFMDQNQKYAKVVFTFWIYIIKL